MLNISIRVPPIELEPASRNYLIQSFTDVKIAFDQVQNFDPKYVLPERVKVGNVYYFAAAIPATAITGEGLWVYKSTGWTQII